MILVTNDDGIIAPGIKALIEVASKAGEVLVVAPDAPQSGQGHAITITRPVKLRKVDLYKGITAYECSGTPVDCVKLAKNVLLKNQKIDLCVSGINHGSNASINILYSGTMSAAMEASLEGINSIGFSLCDYSFDADFSLAKKYAELLIRDVLANKLDDCRLLNVNIPAGKGIKGIKMCRQARGRWVEEFKEGTDPRGEKYYWLTGRFEHEDQGEDTDIYALENNYISVVPSGFDLTSYPALKSLKRLENLM
jgi:5'-nucleotidase